MLQENQAGNVKCAGMGGIGEIDGCEPDARNRGVVLTGYDSARNVRLEPFPFIFFTTRLARTRSVYRLHGTWPTVLQGTTFREKKSLCAFSRVFVPVVEKLLFKSFL
jgi:hypothetical protein